MGIDAKAMHGWGIAYDILLPDVPGDLIEHLEDKLGVRVEFYGAGEKTYVALAIEESFSCAFHHDYSVPRDTKVDRKAWTDRMNKAVELLAERIPSHATSIKTRKGYGYWIAASLG